MPDLRDLGFMKLERLEGTRPMLEHGIIANTPSDVNTPVSVILPEFANDQAWGPYRWQHNGSDIPQAGDDCLIAFSNRREGWIVAYWSGSYVPPAGGGGTGAVSSVFTRTGAVVAATGDYTVAQVTGAAPLASPAFTGSPTAPTPSPVDNSTAIATTAWVNSQGFLTSVPTAPVTSVFSRTGAVVATTGDYTVSQVTGAAPLASPAFTGTPTAPTPAVGDNSTTLATTAFVKSQGYMSSGVLSFNTRTGAVVPASGDYTVAQVTGAAPLASPTFTGTPAAPTAALDTNTTQLATTAFVLGQLSAAGDGTPAMDGTAGRGTSTHFARADHVHPTDTTRAPLASPAFTGSPTAPTAATADNSTTIATTAYVKAQGYVTSATAPVTSVFTRTGAVVAANGDYYGVVAAALTGATATTRDVGGTVSGAPTTGTFQVGDEVTAQNGQIWVCTAAGTPGTWVAVGSQNNQVTSVFTRTGAVVATSGDYTVAQVTGAAPLASPTFTGTPAAPTAAVDTNTTQLATTAFVLAQAASATPLINGTAAVGTTTRFARGDHVHPTDTTRAPLASPALTGTPTAPTPATSDNSTTLATTAFVKAQGYLTTSAVTSVFTRTGAVVAANGDYYGVVAAALTGATAAARHVGATSTGKPTSGTFVAGDWVTTLDGHIFICTTGGTPGTWIDAGSYGASGSVSTVFSRTGNVVATTGDYTVAQVTGAAPLASPAFTGTPTAPTAATGTNTTQVATTAFVAASLALEAAVNIGAANTDLAWPGSNQAVTLAEIGTGGGTLRSIAAPPVGNGQMICLFNTVTAPVTILDYTTGGTGHPMVLSNRTSVVLQQWASITLMYDGGNWAEIARAPGGAGVSTSATVSAANTDLAWPNPNSHRALIEINVAGGTLRSVGAPPMPGAILGIINVVGGTAVTILNATAGGTGSPFYCRPYANCVLGSTDSIVFMYDGSQWIEVGRSRAIIDQDVSASAAIAVSKIAGAAPLASPALTGTPTAPTPALGDNSTTLATTAYVDRRKPPTQTIYNTAGSGTYTPPTGCKAIFVECVGGGGAGGGAGTTSSGQFSMGTGGGGGQYTASLIQNPASSYAYTVGAGGTPVTGAAGGAGGITSFGSTVVTAGGGAGGGFTAAASTYVFTSPGNCLGGSGGAGTIAINGGSGQIGMAFTATSGYGGTGGYSGKGGAGGTYAGGTGIGIAGFWPGGGGSGGVRSQSTGTTITGGAGGPGGIIITEYY